MCLRCGDRIADLWSILSVIALSATLGTALEVETSGIDEQAAIEAIEDVFLSAGTASAGTQSEPNAAPD